MSDTHLFFLAVVLFLFVVIAGSLSGCASLRSTNEFGSGEHQPDPLLEAAAQAWQAKQH